MRRAFIVSLLLVLLPSSVMARAAATTLQVPQIVLSGIPFDIEVKGASPGGTYGVHMDRDTKGPALAMKDGAGKATGVTLTQTGRTRVILTRDGQDVAVAQILVLPAWVAILPPLIAIAIALLFRQVVPALFLGIWVGAWAIAGFSWLGVVTGLFQGFAIHVIAAASDPDHVAIMGFSLMIGGMLGIVTANGGMQGIVDFIVARGTNTARRGQLTAAVLGLVIFFDDYANTLVVGNTMRPISDRLRISREKLAYIVDSTAAPLACIALVSTWIGYEVGLIESAIEGVSGISQSAYALFFNSIVYNFYPLLALLFVFLVAFTGRDFGPMVVAERFARRTGQVADIHLQASAKTSNEMKVRTRADNGHLARLAVVPIVALSLGLAVGLYLTGEGATLQDIVGSADPFRALLWGSFAGVLVALTLTAGYRVLSFTDAMHAWTEGVKAMFAPLIILVLAWALSSVTDILHTADYLVSVLGGRLPVWSMPALVFIIAAVTAFATGTSWGAMGILIPLVIPLSWSMMIDQGMTAPADMHILYSVIAAVLGGAVWGDHCSPISDTTVLSSVASGCDHVQHVRTQLPYALFVGAVAVVLGTLPAALGAPSWLLLIICGLALYGGLRLFGRPVEELSGVDDGGQLKESAASP